MLNRISLKDVSRRKHTIACATLLFAFATSDLPAFAQVASDTAPPQPAIFSGPQVGETLPPLVIRGAFEPVVGQEIDPVLDAGQQPLVLIFIHDVNRLAIGLTRAVSQYAQVRAGDGLASAVILLDDDPTVAEATLNRIRHALTDKVTHGVSVDGREGPGAYGLNRNVTITILVAKNGKVTANHAIVQPSLQVDLAKILTSIVDVVGGPAPQLDELLNSTGMTPGNRAERQAVETPADMRALLLPLIRKNASDEQVDQAAATIERRANQDPAVKTELARISTTIANSDKLENYGTPRTQFYLKKWAREFGQAKEGTINDGTAEKASRQ